MLVIEYTEPFLSNCSFLYSASFFFLFSPLSIRAAAILAQKSKSK